MTERALSQPDLSPEIQEVLARVLYNQKKYKEAYSTVQEVIKTDPHGDTYNLAGDILIRQGNTEEALAMWQKALAEGCADPDLKRKISDPKAQ